MNIELLQAWWRILAVMGLSGIVFNMVFTNWITNFIPLGIESRGRRQKFDLSRSEQRNQSTASIGQKWLEGERYCLTSRKAAVQVEYQHSIGEESRKDSHVTVAVFSLIYEQ